ncbi:hypothetical protein [Stutzerimonas frequens]|uniref:hypothetical protein n=1 Tax=Stutzerimonas frequens TaxID=2968969 RepID=UPI00190968EC|nr:hypothetical protein [Stutzerimonas frequens]MBK3870472.1 hypothetical protein [Stutzerimonas frequens]MBK3908809.1 hypothetical protein [Stutzerimonas frequens]MBK3929589.1 hypothetical protein [Stutzerimonas frequens]
MSKLKKLASQTIGLVKHKNEDARVNVENGNPPNPKWGKAKRLLKRALKVFIFYWIKKAVFFALENPEIFLNLLGIGS